MRWDEMGSFAVCSQYKLQLRTDKLKIGNRTIQVNVEGAKVTDMESKGAGIYSLSILGRSRAEYN